MAIIAKYFKKIRTYAVDDANQWNVEIASQYGLKVCLGAAIKSDWSGTKSQIDAAIQQATSYPGTVEHIIVGNEVDRVSDPTTVINALN
jgi:exo-beta-1,3-glucanase (GH17 family)